MSSQDDPAAARWRRLVTARLGEMERLSPGLGSVSGDFWDHRAERYAASVSFADTEGDPFLGRLRRVAGPASTAIDVGAGTGRFALPLAAGVGYVTAVDPSAAMLAILRRDAGRLGVRNVTTVEGTWEHAATAVADIAFSAFVLTLIPDARPFLTKLDAAARHHVFLYLGAYCGDAVLDPLWRHFHGAPRAPGPSYLDALAVLRELGIEPAVKVVEIANRRRFATIDEAAEHYRDGLLLTDTPEVRRELEGLLSSWLLGRRGAFRSPLRTVPAAIIHWRPLRDPDADQGAELQPHSDGGGGRSGSTGRPASRQA
jgi:SAM-dependent methyltransferase